MTSIKKIHFSVWRFGAYLLLTVLSGTSAWSRADPQIITLLTPEAFADPREVYYARVMALVLEKTRAEYGDFQIKFTPVKMSSARGLEEAKTNYFPNLMIMTTFQNKYLDDGMDYVRFPIDFGVTGYRICFVSPEAKQSVTRVSKLGELRKFTIGQGLNWPDVHILRHNSLKVTEATSYDNLFRMLVGNRFDLLCRGINELEQDMKNHAGLPGLDYDRSMAIAYSMPRFFIANKSNSKALERVNKGLQLAYKDGSLHKLWQEQYGSALRFANLKQRKIFYLETPNIDRIDFDYKKYYFDPRK